MDVTKKKLQAAAEKNIITLEQVDSLYDFFASDPENTVKFTFNHILYYMGGLIAIAAMTIFVGLSWESFGGAGILAISLLYAAVGLKTSLYFSAKNLPIPAGICATFVVCLTPLAIYGFQQWLGFWPDDSNYQDYHRQIKWHWLYMELGTLLVGFIIALKFKYPFLIMPIAATLWYMTMDITSIIFGQDFTWEMRKLVSLYTGLIMLVIAFWFDIKWHKTADYAFWIYLFGVIAFWGGLSAMDAESEVARFLYFCINLLMIVIGALLARRVFVIFGALGSFYYLSYLASHVFRDDWLFPIALTAIGLGVIYLGVLWQRHEKTLTERLRAKLPVSLGELLESKLQQS